MIYGFVGFVFLKKTLLFSLFHQGDLKSFWISDVDWTALDRSGAQAWKAKIPDHLEIPVSYCGPRSKTGPDRSSLHLH